MKAFCKIGLPVALVTLSSAAHAEIYRCNGPDGPIFSDQKCGPNATTVQMTVTSGIDGGVPDDVKAELARKKAARQQNDSALEPNPNANANYEINTIDTGVDGYLYPGNYWAPGHRPVQRPKPPVDRPVARPPVSEPSVVRLKR